MGGGGKIVGEAWRTGPAKLRTAARCWKEALSRGWAPSGSRNLALPSPGLPPTPGPSAWHMAPSWPLAAAAAWHGGVVRIAGAGRWAQRVPGGLDGVCGDFLHLPALCAPLGNQVQADC